MGGGEREEEKEGGLNELQRDRQNLTPPFINSHHRAILPKAVGY